MLSDQQTTEIEEPIHDHARARPLARAHEPQSSARDAREPLAGSTDLRSDPEPAAKPASNSEPKPSEPRVRPLTADRFLTERLDINRATQAELDLLPNIGPKLAGRIIAFREDEGPIRSLTHLTDIDGIGVRTAEAIEPYIRFE